MELTKKQKIQSAILTLIQYCGLAAFLWLSPWQAEGWLLVPELLGIALAVYAIWTMRQSKLQLTPVPREGSILIQTGPYKYIRHPMYASIILSFIPLLISYFSWTLFIVFAILFINLIFKLRFEEALLIKKFYDYRQYSEKTKYIIPFIY